MNLQNRNLSLRMKGEDVQLLQRELRQLGFKMEDDDGYFGAGTRQAVLEFQKQHGIETSGIVDPETAKAINAQVDALAADKKASQPELTDKKSTDSVPADKKQVDPVKAPTNDPALLYRIEGHIVLDNTLPAAMLNLRLYSRGFGGAEALLGESKTNDSGSYTLVYELDGKLPNVELRAVDQEGKEIALSAIKFNAAKNEVLNLVAPSRVGTGAAFTEYARLIGDLAKPLGTVGKLTDAREDKERQDLTLLQRATGWDARLIALAAIAHKVSADTGILEEAFYGLLRVGLPSDKQQLAQLSVEALEQALSKANKAGIVALDEKQIEAVKQAFKNLAATTRLQVKAPGAVSSFGDLLDKSGLEDKEKSIFAEVYFANQATPDELWQKAREKGISEKSIQGLQLQGKLAYLTLNNADLAASLQLELGSTDNLVALANKRLYRTDEWVTRLNALAGDPGKLDEIIPTTYPGDTPAERRDAYAADLARKVRLSFPTQVVAQMIRSDELRLGDDHDTLKQPLAEFMQNAVAAGFELGRTPVVKFIREKQTELFQDKSADEIKTITQGVKKLQRLYQITPTNEALKTVFDLGFTAASDVTAFPYEVFVDRFGDKFPSLDEAQLVYRKAQQVTAVTLNVLTAAQLLDSNPVLYAISAPAECRAQAKQNLVQQYPALEGVYGSIAPEQSTKTPANLLQPAPTAAGQVSTLDTARDVQVQGMLREYPTMEGLFKSLDFCECEECRSVLSPAAYFVDLLQFLDPKPTDWVGTLNTWKRDHHEAPYPFNDMESWNKFLATWRRKYPGTPNPNTQRTAYDVLIERRPDLANLPLTCENTNTVLPYIDIVNEILEYYVAYDRLTIDAARDTGTATTPELLAEPQNIIPHAYKALQGAHYPLILPFDLALETVHPFLNHFDISLSQLLELFRPTDELFPRDVNPKPYYRADIFSESLGVSPEEYKLFTKLDPLADWYELYGYDTRANALADERDQDDQHIGLRFAKTLSRRLGISYQELLELVQTGFVNPHLDALVILRKLELDVEDVFRYKNAPGYAALTVQEQTAFTQKLGKLTQIYQGSGFDAGQWLDTAWENRAFDRIIVFADPTVGCSFDETVLQYTHGVHVEDVVFLKMNLFVRLCRKLGWTMEELDRALSVFMRGAIPSATDADFGKTFGRAFRTALVYLAHLRTLDEKTNLGRNSRLKLLTLWTNLFTTGRNPLYVQLFLTPSVLKNDPVFDDPLGNYLPSHENGLKKYVKDHLLALQGALNLTANDIGLIFADAGQVPDMAELSLGNVSLLYRYGILAKAMKLSVRDLIALKTLSGLDPFKPLVGAPIDYLAEDYPFVQTLEFLKVAGHVQDSGLLLQDLDYLLRHRFDPVGKYRPESGVVVAMVKALAAGIRRVQAEHTITDPDDLTDELLQQKLSLVLPSQAVQTFFQMWKGTVEFKVAQNPVQPADQLASRMFAAEPAITIRYDEVLREQELVFRGVLTDEKKASLLGAHPTPLLTTLLNDVQAQETALFDSFFDMFFGTYPLGFAGEDELKALFVFPRPVLASFSEAEKQSAIQENKQQLRAKRTDLVHTFIPFLQEKLSRQLVVQLLTSGLNSDPALTEALLTDAKLLPEPGVDPTQPPKSLLEAFAAAGERGVSAAFFASTDGSGNPLRQTTLLNPEIAADANNASAHFEGYFEVPNAGAYRFFVTLGMVGAQAELNIGDLPDPLIRFTATADSKESIKSIELKSGVPYHFSFDARNLQAGAVELLIQGENLPTGSLSRLTLYPNETVERVGRARLLLAKTLQLAQSLGLSQRDINHLLTHPADFDNLQLNKLPTREAQPEIAADISKLFAQFLRLAAYARLKRDLASGTDDLIALFENARRTIPADAEAAQIEQLKTALFTDVCKRLADLTRRDVNVVIAAAEALGILPTPNSTTERQDMVQVPDFVQEKGIGRLWQALQVVGKLGVSVAALTHWITPQPDLNIARNLRDSVKARYEPENWQRLAQPIFDKLRRQQRDALVAYIIHRRGFKRPEQLFEYFLIDPGMEPIVQTSRLRLAISSVQLFIQRCLLNLEPQVNPSVINSKHWQWLKHYRAWEANRKIFLYPENWLEPEFRDDKSHLYKELEGALLQGDVSNDLAEDAFFNYLKKLEEIARLDIVAMYLQENANDPASNTLHVIGRTFNLPHKYFYRRCDHTMWTAWEPVTTEIEGDHVVAVVWRERLHLFWVTFLEKAKEDTNADVTITAMANQTVGQSVEKQVEVQLNWSEYYQGQWTARASSGFGNPIRMDVENGFKNDDVFIYLSKEYDKSGQERGVKISLHLDKVSFLQKVITVNLGVSRDTQISYLIPYPDPIHKAFHVVSKNSQPEIQDGQAPQEPPYLNEGRDATRYKNKNALKLKLPPKIILGHGSDFGLLVRSDTMDDALTSPFFYADNQYTFFVEPSLTEVPISKQDGYGLADLTNVVNAAKMSAIVTPIALQVPVVKPNFPPEPPDALALFKMESKKDWATAPGTTLPFGDQLVGQAGGLGEYLA